MTNAKFPRVRGIVGARAEVEATPAAIMAAVAKVNTTFETFKAENDARLKEVEKNRPDVVTAEKVDRINADLAAVTTAANEMKMQLDAQKLGGGAADGLTAEQKAHKTAFNSWFRRGNIADADLRDLQVKAALTTQVDPDGGFVVPAEMDATITRVLSTVSAMRGISRVIRTASGEYKALVSQGGAGAGWVGEEAARSETASPKLSEISVYTGELYANPSATQRVLEDANINIEQWLADEVATTFAEQEGGAFISGNGINKPKGILAYTTAANASYVWGKLGFVVTGAAAAFAGSNPADAIINLLYALKAGYRNNASFLTSDVVMGTVRQMKDGQSNYLWAPPTVSGPETILGKPVVTDDNMPALGAGAFPMAVGDFSRGYLITDRTGVEVLRDPFTNKPYVSFYTRKRVGGAVANFEAIKLLKCST